MSTADAEEMTLSQYERPEKKRSFIARFRRRSKNDDNRENTTPSPTISTSAGREEAAPESAAPVMVTPESNSSKPEKVKRAKSRVPFRKNITLDHTPSPRESAFSGPPRYDWIDVESAAAIKVQAAYRRNKVLKELQEQGLTTAGMRNRSRRRKARRGGGTVTDDAPGLFDCCGVGLAFGDATEDYEAIRQQQKLRYEQRKKAREEREALLRSQYGKRHYATRQPEGGMVSEEAYEIVE